MAPTQDENEALKDPLVRASFLENEMRRRLAEVLRITCKKRGLDNETLTSLLQDIDPAISSTDVARLLHEECDTVTLRLVCQVIAVLEIPSPLIVVRPARFHGEVVEDFGEHSHHTPMPEDIEGKTIARFDCEYANVFSLFFSDGTGLAIEADAAFDGIPYMTFCNVCWAQE